MKHISNIYRTVILAVVSAMTLTSCGDFLEIEPRNIVTEDNFWDEKADVESMIMGCYVQMQSDAFMRRCVVWGEVRSDNVIDGTDNRHGEKDMNLHRACTNAIRSDNPYTAWEVFYNVINRCNIIIKKAPEVQQADPDFTASECAAMVAECSGIRALCYFYLVRAFNNVPFYFDPIQSEDEVINLPATSRNEVIDALISDLQGQVGNAYKALPGYKTPGGTKYNSNRMTQNGIYALLCDLCLWRGRYDEVCTYADIVLQAKLKEYDELEYSDESKLSVYQDVPKLFMYPGDTNAPKMTSKLTQQKIEGYPLYTYFTFPRTNASSLMITDNWHRNTFNAERGNGFEGLFELNYYAVGGNDPAGSGGVANSMVSVLYGNWLPSGGNAGAGLLFANSDIGNECDTDNPNPTRTQKNHFFLNANDIRYHTSYHGEKTSGQGSGSNYIRKFNCGTVSLTATLTGNVVVNPVYTFMPVSYLAGNWIFYRISDVLLMKAEALYKQGKYDEAFNLIWITYKRSLIDSETDTKKEVKDLQLEKSAYTASADYMRDLLLGERQREFLFEGKRWFDLVRFAVRDGEYDLLRNAVRTKYSASGSASDLFPNENSLFMPYNKDELKKVNANGTVIPQNPYYLGDEDDE